MQIATDGGRGGPGRPWADVISSGTQLYYRPGLQTLLLCVQLQAATALLIPSRGSELSYTTVAIERERIV